MRMATQATSQQWDHLEYLPIDQRGADLLFQVISQRYERGSIILTTGLIHGTSSHCFLP
jgi:DNA replication protein DnaC